MPFERANFNTIQLRCLFTDICVKFNTYPHVVKCGKFVFWPFQTLRYVLFNSKYPENQPS